MTLCVTLHAPAVEGLAEENARGLPPAPDLIECRFTAA